MAENSYKIDFALIRQGANILQVAKALGLDIKIGNKISCCNKSAHKNGDANPSVAIFPATNTYKCHVCDDKAKDVIDFAQRFGNFENSYKAAEFIAGTIGITSTIQYTPVAKTRSRELLPEHIEVLDALWNAAILPTTAAQAYLKSRSIDLDVAIKAGIRSVTPEIGRTVRSRFASNHKGLEAVFNERNNLRFHMHSMVIPYVARGKCKWMQGRIPSTDGSNQGIKEMSPGIPLTIPGLPGGIFPESEYIWLCEGAMDGLSVLTAGKSSIWIPGAGHWHDSWAPRFSGRKVINALDNDKAGRNGADKIKASLSSYCQVVNAMPPQGMDLNDLHKAGSLHSFLESTENLLSSL